MRFRLRTLLIVAGFGPAIVWAMTAWLAAYLEWVGPHDYKAAKQDSSRPSAVKPAKLLAP
jgi:hypothetical protein